MSLINIYEGWNAKLQLSGIWGRCTLVSQVYANKFRLRLFLTMIYHHGKQSSHCSLKLNFTLELYYSITFWDIMIKKKTLPFVIHGQRSCHTTRKWLVHTNTNGSIHHGSTCTTMYTSTISSNVDIKLWKLNCSARLVFNTNSSDLTPIYIYM